MKSFKNISFFLVLAVAATFFASQSFKTQPMDKYMGPPVFLYKSQTPQLMTEATLKIQASKLAGLSDIKVEKGEGVMGVAQKNDDPSELFEQDVQGSIRFSRSLKKYEGDFKPQLPPMDNAEKVARKLLTDNNLMPGNQSEMKLAHIGGLKATKAETKAIIDKMRTVTFSREIDGLPVVGPGSKIVVNIGHQQEFQGLIHRWKELDTAAPQGKVALKQDELRGEKEARDQISTRIKSDWGPKAQFKLENVKMAYFDSNDGYIQPVYVFQTSVTPDGDFGEPGKAKVAQKYLGFVPVMKNGPEKIFTEVAPPKNVKIQEGKLNDANPVGAQPDKD